MNFAFASALLLLASQERSKPTLLQLAKPTPVIANWQPQRAYDYEWLTDSTLLDSQQGFTRVDASRGKARSLVYLNNAISTRRWNVGQWKLSPNKEWLLNNVEGFFAIKLDGTGASWYGQFAEYIKSGAFTWLANIRHWVAMPTWANTSYRRNAVNENDRLKIHTPGEAPFTMGRAYQAVSLSSRNRIRVLEWEAHEDYQEIADHSLDLTQLNPKWRRRSILLPRSGRIEEIAIDDRNKRIAWLLFIPHHLHQEGTELTLKQQLARDSQRLKMPVELWTTDGNGSHARLIGRQLLPVRIERHHVVGFSWSPAGLHSIRWLPSGRQISFIHDNRLWLVPIGNSRH
jgi:hypothetical protein